MKTSMEDGKHEKKSNQRMLSAALIAGTLAGCGSDNSDSTESTAVESTAQKVRTAVMARPKETPNTRTLLQLMYLTAWQTIRESSLAGLQKS